MVKLKNKKIIYLDHAGGTPMDEGILKAMSLLSSKFFVSPGAIYDLGVKEENIINESRGKIAKCLNAHADEIIFTGSGTESDAMAIIGIITNYELRIRNEKTKYKIPHIITSKIEHPAVLENCKMLEERGEAEVAYIGVDENGIVKLDELKKMLKENTVLVSIMYANNEVGTVQPIEEIAKIIRHFRKGKSAPQGLALGSLKARPFPADFPLFHTDACQAMNYLFTENIEKLGVDLMTFNGSKIYGPKGIGVLYKKRNIKISPLYSGGGQEYGLRSGTENVSAIYGIAEALSLANKIKNKESKKLKAIRDYGIKKILSLGEKTGYKIILNGDREKRLPNNINISIKGISSELLVIELSASDIYVSEKSACESRSEGESHVIRAIRNARGDTSGNDTGSLRITLGRGNKKSDMDVLYKELEKILEKYKKFRKP